MALDDDERVTRIEPSAELVAERLGIPLELGKRLSSKDRQRMAECLSDILIDYLAGREPSRVGPGRSC